MRFLKEFVSDLRREFHGYNSESLLKDTLAGITVAAVALPLALAFGVGSGADAAAGLITAIISAFLISALSGASYQVSGPTGAMTAILIPLVARHGLETLFAATFLAGILLILAAILQLGNLVYILPVPVITGFTSGIALIIALGQLGNIFGVPLQGENALGRVFHLAVSGTSPNWYALGIGLFVIALMIVWPKKWSARIPGSLAGVIFATILSALLKLPIETVGIIPKTLIHSNHLSIFDIRQIKLDVALIPAVSIAALCMIESLLCGAAGGRMKGERMRADRELLSQGLGNMLLPFLGGVPTTAAIARTSVAIKSGCQTRLTGIIHGVVLLLSMFLLGPLMSKIPMSALAGVLMVTAWRMNDWDRIHYLFQRKFKRGIMKYAITMVTTVMFDLTIAIAVGVLFSIAIFVINISTLQVSVSKIDTDKLDLPDSLIASGLHKDIQVVYITGAVFFGSLEQLESGLNEANAPIRILSMRGVPFVDTSAVSFFLDYCLEKQSEGITVLFSSIQPSVKEMLDRAGITDVVGDESYFMNAKDAIMSQID